MKRTMNEENDIDEVMEDMQNIIQEGHKLMEEAARRTNNQTITTRKERSRMIGI